MQLFRVESISQSDNTDIFRATLDPTHRIFEGHFPDNPVVPGVCTIEMIKRCCCIATDREVRFESIKEVKFLAMILPSQHRELEVRIEFREAMSISVVVLCGEITMLKLRATLVES